MKFEELTVLLPCHSLEDFPLYHEGEEAEGLLAAWSALWHPELIAAVGKVPTWERADSPPHDPAGHLITIPDVAEPMLPADFAAEVAAAGGRLLPRLPRRAELVAAALAEIERTDERVSSSLVADFFALGTAFLLVELLTRRMRYSSTLDEPAFQAAAIAAASAAVHGDEVSAREELKRCFTALADARQHFYPVDTYLLDWTLVAPSTLGAALRAEVARGLPLNVMLCGATLDRMAQHEPDTLGVLRSAIESGTVAVIGGEYEERDLPLLPMEAIRAELQRGRQEYERQLGARPRVFARRRFGLTPVLPQILRKWGFEAALHVTLDDGRVPQVDRSKFLWEGLDGTAIDALGRVPLDAADPAGLWKLPDWLGTTMDMDHVAAVTFAHWPGLVSPWYEDVRRMTDYAPVLGKFAKLVEFFDDADSPLVRTRLQSDEYRSPYLAQAVSRRQPDPISRYVRYYMRRAAADAAQTLTALTSIVRSRPTLSTIADLPDEVERRAADFDHGATDFDKQLAAALRDATNEMSLALPGDAGSAARGYLVFNPLSWTRQVEIDTPELIALPAADEVVLGAQEQAGRKWALVEVPAMGFAWVGVDSGAAPPKTKPARKNRPPVARDHRLINDWFEVAIHQTTGGIQAIYDVGRRGNRLSQQIALRMPDEWNEPNSPAGVELWHDVEDGAIYSAMAADAIEITATGPNLGEITSRGRLLDPAGRRVAGFRQTVRLWQTSRIVQVEIELDPAVEPSSDPWNSYYAARFAWSDESSNLRRGVHQMAQATDAARIDAPQFIELDSVDRRTCILTGGLPFHRRVGFRKLDSLLVVRGETARTFRLAIGIDLPNPATAGTDFFVPPTVASMVLPPARTRSGWFFHVSGNNVIATHWEPLLSDGRVEGIRVRLLETQGRPTRTTLRTFRPAVSARLLDFENRQQGDLHVEGDQVKLDFAAYEWLQVEARFVEPSRSGDSGNS